MPRTVWIEVEILEELEDRVVVSLPAGAQMESMMPPPIVSVPKDKCADLEEE